MLTARQKELVEFIAAETERRGGVAPTQWEMARALGLKSTNHVSRMIESCIERGALARLPHRARAVEVIPRPGKRTAWFRFDEEIKELVPLNGGGE